MEQVMKHYGNAILVAVVMLLLGAIMYFALNTDSGYVANEFKTTMTSFFTSMNAFAPGVPGTP